MMLQKVLKHRGVGLHDPPARWGHTGILGKSGYGKGTTGQMLAEKYYDKRDEKGRRYKVLIWTMFRSENTTMGFAEDNPEMLKILYSKGEKPRAFSTEVLVPVFQRGTIGKVQVRIPETWKPVKINYKDLTRRELLFLVGDTSDKAEQILDALPLDEFNSLGELQKKIIELANDQDALIVSTGDGGAPADIGHKTIYGTISRAVGSLLKKNIVVSDLPKGFSYLDLEEMQRDSEKVTVIAGNCCWNKENFMTVFINVMSRLIHYRHLHSGEMPRMAVYVPEISNFDDAITKRLLTFILQEARDAGMDILVDTQIPKNIPGSVKDQITRWYLFNLSPEARDYFHQNLKEIPYEYGIYDAIPNLEQGVCVLLYQGGDYKWQFRKPTMINPPKSHKKVGYESINDYFEKQGVVVRVVEDEPNKEIVVGFASQQGLKKTKKKGVNTFVKEDGEVIKNAYELIG